MFLRDVIRLEAFRVGDRDPQRERRQETGGCLEGMMERQDREETVPVVEPEKFRGRDEIGDDVPVGQHHPLRVAGGAGSINDRGERFLSHGGIERGGRGDVVHFFHQVDAEIELMLFLQFAGNKERFRFAVAQERHDLFF